MFVFAIALLQVAAPSQAGTPPEPVVAPQPVEESADAAPPEPKMKRVCRKVIDPRVGTLAGRQTVCKYVPADDAPPRK